MLDGNQTFKYPACTPGLTYAFVVGSVLLIFFLIVLWVWVLYIIPNVVYVSGLLILLVIWFSLRFIRFISGKTLQYQRTMYLEHDHITEYIAVTITSIYYWVLPVWNRLIWLSCVACDFCWITPILMHFLYRKLQQKI